MVINKEIMIIKNKRNDNDDDRTESFPLFNYSNDFKNDSTVEFGHIQLISELHRNKDFFKPANNINQLEFENSKINFELGYNYHEKSISMVEFLENNMI
jgi:hypothetical protein